jgi:hypothetical protein
VRTPVAKSPSELLASRNGSSPASLKPAPKDLQKHQTPADLAGAIDLGAPAAEAGRSRSWSPRQTLKLAAGISVVLWLLIGYAVARLIF